MKQIIEKILNLSGELPEDFEEAKEILYEIYTLAEKAASELED